MLKFLSAFIAWLYSQDIIPQEVTELDIGTDRENKTYLMNFPDDASNVVCVRQYNQRLNTDVCRDACIRYIQILVRNTSHVDAISLTEKVFQFMKERPEMIEDMDSDYWVLIQCTNGPSQIEQDQQGRYVYGISFPITTQI